ncbi:MAG: DUF1800 family protein [Verrucomicrobiales bacterium]
MKSPILWACVGIGWLLVAGRAGAASYYGLDQNGNGISDLFEMRHPGMGGAEGDPDGDGVTNVEEAAAGTNPVDGKSRLMFEAVGLESNEVRAQWAGVAGKRYQLQASSGLGDGGWANEGVAQMGRGGELEAVCPATSDRMFLRLVVADTDSDGDGVTDYEEALAGTNPMNGDTDDDGIYNDKQMLSLLLNGDSVVSVVAGTASTAEGGDQLGVFTFTRRGSLRPLTAAFTVGGTATAGADYTLSPQASVFFDVGQTTATVTVTPVADAVNDPNETVVVTLVGSPTFESGSPASASMIIEDAGSPNGSGLFGQYYNNANTTYSSPNNFDPLDLKLERVDPRIEFNWGSGTPHPSLTRNNAFTVRWTGQIKPQFSEPYTLYWQADRSGKLWIDGNLVIDQWNDDAAEGGIEHTATVSLVAGQRYAIRIDYRESSSTELASARLSWSSPSVAKEVIPTSRLTPVTGLPPIMTSPGFVVGLLDGSLSHQLTASNEPDSFFADGLPEGLTLNPATGLISGTPTQTGQLYVTVGASNETGTGTAVLSLIILETGGGLTHDVWQGVSGLSLQSAPLHLAPTSTATVAEAAAPANLGDNFADRLRGWITAPATGNFTFFLTTADENAELWVSSSDDASRRLKRCFLQGTAASGQWNGQPSQKSIPMRLRAGQRYYFEAVRKEATGADQFAIGWRRPADGDSDSPAEVIPGYCLSPFVAEPPSTGNPGTLFITRMGPQATAQTLGAGAATLLLNEDQTEATIYVNWANLTGPKTQLHVHDATRGGLIIFDFDTETPDNAGAYHWVLAPTGGVTENDIRQTLLSGQAYVNVHTAAYPAGEIQGFLAPVTGSRDFTPPPPPPSLNNGPIAESDAIRFLQHATFGLSRTDTNGDSQLDAVAEVQSLGYAGWIDRQMNEAVTPKTLLRPQITQFNLDYPDSDGDISEDDNEIFRFWWKAAVTGPDQLRQRIAFALSQILVVSEMGPLDENATAVTSYYDLLVEEAFGNFRSLLERMTLHYSMGRYLDMAGNRKANPATGRTANENYAREILQLFTIGLKRLHPDGTIVLGPTGLPVETYNQDVVVGFANNFTGWNSDTATEETFYRQRYTRPMTLSQNDHEQAEKLLLESSVLPARNDATRDLADAHDQLFHHQNIAPFISRQLIQRLVTANPSPGYIYRVTRAFEDDGTGVRGNLGAVVRAILLDYEARSLTVAQQPGFGHLREPVLRVTHALRALGGRSMSQGKPMANSAGSPKYVPNPAYDSAARSQTVPPYLPPLTAPPSPGWDFGSTSAFSQTPLRAPTVFNFYEPDYVFSGATGTNGLVSPEFQITAETTVAGFANWIYELTRNGRGANTNWDNTAWQTMDAVNPPTAIDLAGTIYRYNTTTVNGVAYPETPRASAEGPDIQLDLAVEKSLAYSEDALIDRLNRLLLGNAMSPELRTSLRTYLGAMSRRVGGTNEINDRATRAADAVYLIILSPEFSVQR